MRIKHTFQINLKHVRKWALGSFRLYANLINNDLAMADHFYIQVDRFDFSHNMGAIIRYLPTLRPSRPCRIGLTIIVNFTFFPCFRK